MPSLENFHTVDWLSMVFNALLSLAMGVRVVLLFTRARDRSAYTFRMLESGLLGVYCALTVVQKLLRETPGAPSLFPLLVVVGIALMFAFRAGYHERRRIWARQGFDGDPADRVFGA